MFEMIFLFFVSAYFVFVIIFIIGATKKLDTLPVEKLPAVSVLVAVRNEEKNILRCLTSLDKLNYPEGKLEIALINDNSTDRTAEIISDFIKDKKRFKLIDTKEKIGALQGKANAIANGIKTVAGEIILTTDADCEVNPNWAKTIASYYSSGDIAMVCSYTNQIDKTYFGAIQSIDFIYLEVTACGSMHLDKPLGGLGNNMSFRKTVYDELGGYESLPFSVTEDFRLIMAINKLKKYKIVYPTTPDTLVTSIPCENLKQLYWQKKRWLVGGLESTFFGFLVLTTSFLTHVLMAISPFFFSATVLYLFIFKILIDYFYLKPVHRKLKIDFKTIHFLLYEFYYVAYTLILPVTILLGKKVRWKGREF